MYVIKRDGSREPSDFSKIRKQTKDACEGLDGVSFNELESGVLSKINKSEIRTSDIQDILINTALSMVDIDRPNWTFVAARLYLYDLYHKMIKLYGKSKPKQKTSVYDIVSLRDTVEKLLSMDKLSFNPFESGFDIDDLQKYIKPDRDHHFSHPGIKSFVSRYSIKDFNGNPIELPQYIFMLISMYLANVEKENKTEWAKKFYDVLSTFLAECATPILSNARRKNGVLYSCYVGVTGDSLESIFDAYKIKALISKDGGGIGWDYSMVRSYDAPIRGQKGLAKGKIPFIKIDNDISVAVDQLGVRKGSINAYCAVWDREIFEFLDLKKTGGDERRTAEDVFIALVVDDVFMEKMDAYVNGGVDSDYWLFDPYDVPELNRAFGSEFKKHYEKYVEKAENDIGHFYNPPKKIKISELVRKIILYYWNTGMPFWFFKDNANKAHNHPEEGMIRTSNLCMEIMMPTDLDRTIVCNLASINVSKVNTKEDIKKVVPIVVRMLDNVIDATEYINEDIERVQKHTRSIGIGIMGEAQLLAESKVYYGSDEHKRLVEELYKNIYGTAYEASKKLAEERGPWKDGKETRNAYIGAVAPTTTISIIANTTASHEPVYKRKWIEENLFGNLTMVAPGINVDTYQYYTPAHDVDQFKSIEVTGIKQKYVDQGISHNLYFPVGTKASTIARAIVHAWKNGLKSLYYLRSGSKKIDHNKPVCEGCE